MLSKFIGSLTILTVASLIGVKADDVNYTFNIGNAYLAPDGFNRSTVVVNGQFPGPLITANKGDNITVRVVNQLEDPTMRRSTSIHWHGIHQPRNAQNDGPSFVTQCPISPEHEYTYKLDLSDQSGTYWYHSHLTSQYIDGLRGPIVINPQDPNIGLYDVDDDDHIFVLGDWFHDPSPTLLANFSSATNTQGREVLPKSGTINGVGRTSTDPQPPYPVFKVEQGKRYRFRIINISAIVYFNFQIQGHSLRVIEADGEPHQQVQDQVDWLTIFPGMRYSVVVEANQNPDNYWIHAPMGNDHVLNPAPPDWATDSINVNAVLRYDGAPDADPTGTPADPPTGTQLREDLLVPLVDPDVPGQPFLGGADKVFNLAFTANVTDGAYGFFINGIRFKPGMNPALPTLLRILSGARNDSDFPPQEDTRTIKRGDVVEINITGFPEHPFHLHGHTFHVVQGSSGPVNFVNPPKRDIVDTNSFGKNVTIRFVADNPGPWILHCHIELHFDTGLAMVFAEDPAGIVDEIHPSDEWRQLCDIYNSLDPSLQ